MPVSRLKDTHPVLFKELSINQPVGIDVSKLTPGGKVKPRWVCNDGHIYEARVSHRVNGSGCPLCSGRYPVKGKTDLLSVDPVLANEWHPTRNKLRSDEVTANSGQGVWWMCAVGHEWLASVSNRRGGRGCARCHLAALQERKKQSKATRVKKGLPPEPRKRTQKTIAGMHPEVLAFWSSRNADTFENTPAWVKGKLWWVCQNGHEWKERLEDRIQQPAICTLCEAWAGIPTSHVGRLESEYGPDNPFEWKSILPTSPGRVEWVCESGHAWESKVADRLRRWETGKEVDCPVCSMTKLRPGVNDLATTHPDLAILWNENQNLAPASSVTVSTAKKVWWRDELGHQWKATPARLVAGDGCPFCRGREGEPKEFNLVSIHPELGDRWLTELNDEVPVRNIGFAASGRYWWAGSCGHPVKASIRRLLVDGVKKCSVCNGRKIVAGVNDFSTTHPNLASQWHPTKNGALLPTQIRPGRNQKVWWKCAVDGAHEWKASSLSRTRLGVGCPFCSGREVLRGVSDLTTVNPRVASEWHPTKNAPLSANDIPASSGKTFWWQCSAGHEWPARAADRNRPTRATDCPVCSASAQSSRGEVAVRDFLENLLGDKGLVFSNDRIAVGQELDIYIPSKNFAVEFNGLYWHSEKFRASDSHRKKWLACKEQGIQLIQVWEDEWLRNPDQVKRMLAHKLGFPYGDEVRVMARKTQAVPVTKAQAEVFLDGHHVQGHANGSYYLGLVRKDVPVDAYGQEDLLAVLVLKREAGTDGKTLSIIRYATAAVVPGGFTKLLKHAERTYEPERFITFSDHCVSDGGLYKNNGFVADKELPPDYMYVVGGVRKHKFGYRLKRFRNDPALKWEEGLTERELAELNGLKRVWDAGKTRWVKVVSG